jgi:DnaJ-class molecular chaperone
MSKEKNYYEILEIEVKSTQDEIRQGYMRAKNAYSGDSIALYSLMTAEECRKILEIIDEAYSILSDPTKRNNYNVARGLVPVNETELQTEKNQEKLKQENPKSEPKQNLTKIVASNKFNLDYPVDPVFEQEIEQATEFSGEFLKKIREYKGVSLERMSEMTKVSKTYLKNMEECNMKNLPAVVYVRGFIFQYAKCLKLNPELVATSYIHFIKNKKP